MAAGEAPGQRLASFLVASLTLLLPLSALLWSAAQVAPPLSAAPSRVVTIEAVLPPGTPADEPVGSLAARDGAGATGASSDTAAPDEAPAPDIVEAPPVVVPAATIAAATPVPIATVTPRIEAWTREASFNFVALGVDQRAEGELTRTDTLMIGSIDTVRRRLTVLSVPRDLLVDIPGYGLDRINSTYVYGEQFKEPDGGIGLLKRTIEANFGLPIQHYGLIDFTCFRTAVDAVGGVTIDVPREINDPYYPTDDYGLKLVRFEVGPQRMDGERALEYARTRNADNDFGRIRRQQLVASALRSELLTLRTLPALPSLVGGCRNMRSDLGWRDYLALASVVRTLRDRDVAFRAIDEQMATITTLSTGASVLVPRWEPIRAMIRESFSGPTRPTTAAIPADKTAPDDVGARDGWLTAVGAGAADGPTSAATAGQPNREALTGAPVIGAPGLAVPVTN